MENRRRMFVLSLKPRSERTPSRAASKYGFRLVLVLTLAAMLGIAQFSGFYFPGLSKAYADENSGISGAVQSWIEEGSPQIRRGIDVKERHEGWLMQNPNILGVGVGIKSDGSTGIRIFTEREASPGEIPGNLDGIPVTAIATGKIYAIKSNPAAVSSAAVKTTSRFPRPVPIGVSTGNANAVDCSTGTIGARVKDAKGNVYALSNNHVFALSNQGNLLDPIIQPGLFDLQPQPPTSCSSLSQLGLSLGTYAIGSLFNFVPICFDGVSCSNSTNSTGNNVVDAAIAATTTGQVGNSTPSNGYGTPFHTTRLAAVNMSVQKYGRTTQLTRGAVYVVGATVVVTYSSTQTATFTHQIGVFSSRGFIGAGDSGSLLVNSSGYPVGLLFAGNSSGSFAFANPINPALNAFGVSIDGK